MQLCKSALPCTSGTLTFRQNWCRHSPKAALPEQVTAFDLYRVPPDKPGKHMLSRQPSCCTMQASHANASAYTHHAIMPACNLADDDKSSSIKRRSAFRLLSELLVVGVYSDASVLLGVVKHLAVFDFQRDRDAAQASLSVLASFAKSCRQDVLGLGQQLLPALIVGEADQASA